MATLTGIDLLIAEFGDYYSGQVGATDLHDDIFTTSDIKTLFMTSPTDRTYIPNVNLSHSKVLQPFYAKFSTLGKMDFKPNTFTLDRVKINEEVIPDELAATALDFLNRRGVSVLEAPLLVTLAKYMIAKAKEDDEEEVAFLGVQKTPTTLEQSAGTAGLTVDSRDGIRHKIRTYNAAGVFADLGSMIAMGAVPTVEVDFVTYVETMYYSIPEKYRKFIRWFSMSEALRTRFMRGMRTKYNQNYEQAGSLLTIMDTTVQILGFAAQNGSSMIWTSFPENCKGFIKNSANKNVFDMEVNQIYKLLMATDWYETYDFVNPAWIWTNGQELSLV